MTRKLAALALAIAIVLVPAVPASAGPHHGHGPGFGISWGDRGCPPWLRRGLRDPIVLAALDVPRWRFVLCTKPLR